MIRRERLGTGTVDLGDLPDDVATLQTDLDAAEAEIDGLDSRVDAMDGVSAIGNVGGSISLTPGSGNGTVKTFTLTSATCNVTFNNGAANGRKKTLELVISQDATGGRLVTWVSNVLWPGGTDPTLSTGANAIDRFIFVSYNNGTTWYGHQLGLAYS